MRLIEQTTWDGVAVVGGGVAGLLTAQRIAERGVPALVIEAKRLGGGQTAHAHGWLHRGHVFAEIERNEVEQLRLGADWWRERLSDISAPRIAEEATVAFSERVSATQVVSNWRRVGLEAQPVEPLSKRLAYTYQTNEWSVSPVVALRAVVESGPHLHHVRANVIGLRRDGVDGTANLVLDRGGRHLLLRPRGLVVAAGAGSAQLLSPTLSAPSMQLRRSHMVVVKTGANLPAAIALPQQTAKGLFGVKRETDSASYWLFSNFLSYGGQHESAVARDNWRRSILRTLETYLPELTDDAGALWGSYPALKSELIRSIPLGVPGQGVVPAFASNACTVVPGKFTAAPTVAAAAADFALSRLGPLFSGRETQLDRPSRWAEEDWEMTPLSPLGDFSRKAS